MKINKKSITKLQKSQKKPLNNLNYQKIKLVTANGSVILLSCEDLNHNLLSEDFPVYAYIPYNKRWGLKEEIHKVKVMVTGDGLGVLKGYPLSVELSNAVQKCLGKETFNEKKNKDVAFHFLPTPNDFMIDIDSFILIKSESKELHPKTVGLPVSIFISPEGQNWAQEKNYMEYASSQKAIYECSDGSLVASYQQFRDWEKELAYRPQTPKTISYPESEKTLSSIGYFEFSNDGTVWRNQILLEEYLHWLEDKDYGSKDGFYVGFYGICSSFEEYVRIHNVAYFVNEGLGHEEQFLGASGFLYSSSRKAHQSLEGMKKSEMANVKKINNYS